MKKICIVLLTALLLVLVTGCGKDESRLLDVDTTVDNDKSDATSEDKMQVSGNEQETETDTKEDSNEVKVLVVYFSATGNTKVIAEDILILTRKLDKYGNEEKIKEVLTLMINMMDTLGPSINLKL